MFFIVFDVCLSFTVQLVKYATSKAASACEKPLLQCPHDPPAAAGPRHVVWRLEGQCDEA